MIDAFYRVAYRVAYQGARVYWRLTHPDNHGSLVAIWYQGKVLLVQNSYVNYLSLPGGHVKQNESAVKAAVRELREEIGLNVSEDDLNQVLDHTHQWKGRTDHVEFFELEVSVPPVIQVDRREVVSAEWFTPDEALRKNLFPPLRLVIESKRAVKTS